MMKSPELHEECSLSQDEDQEKKAEKLRKKNEEGLTVVEVEGKGRGVVPTRLFQQGELICEYSGERITEKEARLREEEYSKDPKTGCYMYYFTHKETKWW